MKLSTYQTRTQVGGIPPPACQGCRAVRAAKAAGLHVVQTKQPCMLSLLYLTSYILTYFLHICAV